MRFGKPISTVAMRGACRSAQTTSIDLSKCRKIQQEQETHRLASNRPVYKGYRVYESVEKVHIFAFSPCFGSKSVDSSRWLSSVAR